ncbi:MAG: hypothetical protein O7A71_01645, partial [Chloroflexi bacterium]|nr:hypothetical protein [Chloroflexota bacterium]
DTTTEADLQRRLAAASQEMAAADEFDHVLINHDGQETATVDALLAILARERQRPNRPAPSI